MPTEKYDNKISRAKERLEKNENIIEENKNAILDFERDLRLNDYSKARRYKYLSKLPKMAEAIEVPFKKAEKKDIEDIVIWINERNDINETTKGDYKVLLKRFMKFIGNGEYPESVKWIKTTNKVKNGKLPEEMLTEDDIQTLIDHAKNPRDRALISLLWETGARIGELIDLTIGSLEDHRHGYKIIVDGKTGSRRLPLIESVPYIQGWLQAHPDRNNKEAPLWVNVGTVRKGQGMSYHAIRKTLIDISDRANIDKSVNPHIFRHSRATYLANRFTEAQLCEWFGWVQGSDVPSKYVHLSGRDIDSSYARLQGIEEEEDQEKSKRAPKECPRCQSKVPPEADYCHMCGQVLSIEAKEEMEIIQEDAEEKIIDVSQDNPDMIDDMRKIKNLMEKLEESGLMKYFRKDQD